ncbi:MAG: hypothetical protein ISR76_00220 [Planctomycetes bacterium]|nr:hypothetical protein [Planctomycetota bacterium]MBL7007395.1 hypothetical protein [Planctomycetota bacterium]
MRPATRSWTRFAVAVGAAWLLGACLPTPRAAADPVLAPATAVAEPAADPAAWQRLAVLGASASVGYGTQGDGGRPVGLAEILDAALLVEHDPPAAHATDLFFINPEDWGRILLDQALAEEPTAVVAIDYLFWFVYGGKESEEQRLQELERGLAGLARFRCPLVLGEIPDMSASVGKMLARSQMPAAETLAAANRRLRAWAGDRDGTYLLVLAPRAGEGLIQADELHPTVLGLSGIALDALRALPGGVQAAERGDLLDDPEHLALQVQD